QDAGEGGHARAVYARARRGEGELDAAAGVVAGRHHAEHPAEVLVQVAQVLDGPGELPAEVAHGALGGDERVVVGGRPHAEAQAELAAVVRDVRPRLGRVGDVDEPLRQVAAV